MTEMMIREDRTAVETYEPPTTAVATLVDWHDELLAAGSIAAKLCNTPFVPQHFRGKPADAAAAILTGRELGLSPMASLRSIFLISGTPGMYSKTMLAVVQAQGHEVHVEEQSDERVVVSGRRKDSEHVTRTVWDRARVVKAKLQGNAKYQENPQQMMAWRGIAEMCRLVAPDALLGVPYSVEELADFEPTPEPRRRMTAAEVMADAPVSAVVVEGRDEAEVVDEQQPTRRPNQITREQSTKLHATLGDLGLGGKANRENGLAKISLILKHDIDTTDAMTKTEASHVIDVLEQELRRKRNAEAAQIPRISHEWSLDDLFRSVNLTDEPAQLRYACEVVGRSVGSLDDLSESEHRQLVQHLANRMVSESDRAGDES